MTTKPIDTEKVLSAVDAGLDQSLERLFELLRMPSISTDPAYKTNCADTADWLVKELTDLGFEAEARPTAGHPVVLARTGGEGPRALFYGHYDVQPVDPLELWSSDPFDPQIVTGKDGAKRIVARGASDDKGQVMTFVEACRAFKQATGALPMGLTLMIEGEEETGSTHLEAFMKQNRADLAADIALVCDTDMWDAATPSITTSLRGLVGEEVELSCANRDLHSGMYGSAARNPNQLLADIISSLRNADGSVAVEGFYEGVHEPAEELKQSWAKLDFDPDQFLGEVGLSAPAGEKDRTVFEQTTARPTCEINGISGGYTGEGFKTVIPAKARAKVSFRLVGDQNPEKVRAAFRAHVEARLPRDCTARFWEHGAAPAITVPLDGPFMAKARKALEKEWGTAPVLAGSGGSIPVVEKFKTMIGLDTLLIGFALEDDNIHSPNEKYNLESFHRGIRSWVRILSAFAQ